MLSTKLNIDMSRFLSLAKHRINTFLDGNAQITTQCTKIPNLTEYIYTDEDSKSSLDADTYIKNISKSRVIKGSHFLTTTPHISEEGTPVAYSDLDKAFTRAALSTDEANTLENDIEVLSKYLERVELPSSLQIYGKGTLLSATESLQAAIHSAFSVISQPPLLNGKAQAYVTPEIGSAPYLECGTTTLYHHLAEKPTKVENSTIEYHPENKEANDYDTTHPRYLTFVNTPFINSDSDILTEKGEDKSIFEYMKALIRPTELPTHYVLPLISLGFENMTTTECLIKLEILDLIKEKAKKRYIVDKNDLKYYQMFLDTLPYLNLNKLPTPLLHFLAENEAEKHKNEIIKEHFFAFEYEKQLSFTKNSNSVTYNLNDDLKILYSDKDYVSTQVLDLFEKEILLIKSGDFIGSYKENIRLNTQSSYDINKVYGSEVQFNSANRSKSLAYLFNLNMELPTGTEQDEKVIERLTEDKAPYLEDYKGLHELPTTLRYISQHSDYFTELRESIGKFLADSKKIGGKYNIDTCYTAPLVGKEQVDPPLAALLADFDMEKEGGLWQKWYNLDPYITKIIDNLYESLNEIHASMPIYTIYSGFDNKTYKNIKKYVANTWNDTIQDIEDTIKMVVETTKTQKMHGKSGRYYKKCREKVLYLPENATKVRRNTTKVPRKGKETGKETSKETDIDRFLAKNIATSQINTQPGTFVNMLNGESNKTEIDGNSLDKINMYNDIVSMSNNKKLYPSIQFLHNINKYVSDTDTDTDMGTTVDLETNKKYIEVHRKAQKNYENIINKLTKGFDTLHHTLNDISSFELSTQEIQSEDYKLLHKFVTETVGIHLFTLAGYASPPKEYSKYNPTMAYSEEAFNTFVNSSYHYTTTYRHDNAVAYPCVYMYGKVFTPPYDKIDPYLLDPQDVVLENSNGKYVPYLNGKELTASDYSITTATRNYNQIIKSASYDAAFDSNAGATLFKDSLCYLDSNFKGYGCNSTLLPQLHILVRFMFSCLINCTDLFNDIKNYYICEWSRDYIARTPEDGRTVPTSIELYLKHVVKIDGKEKTLHIEFDESAPAHLQNTVDTGITYVTNMLFIADKLLKNQDVRDLATTLKDQVSPKIMSDTVNDAIVVGSPIAPADVLVMQSNYVSMPATALMDMDINISDNMDNAESLPTVLRLSSMYGQNTSHDITKLQDPNFFKAYSKLTKNEEQILSKYVASTWQKYCINFVLSNLNLDQQNPFTIKNPMFACDTKEALLYSREFSEKFYKDKDNLIKIYNFLYLSSIHPVTLTKTKNRNSSGNNSSGNNSSDNNSSDNNSSDNNSSDNNPGNNEKWGQSFKLYTANIEELLLAYAETMLHNNNINEIPSYLPTASYVYYILFGILHLLSTSDIYFKELYDTYSYYVKYDREHDKILDKSYDQYTLDFDKYAKQLPTAKNPYVTLIAALINKPKLFVESMLGTEPNYLTLRSINLKYRNDTSINGKICYLNTTILLLLHTINIRYSSYVLSNIPEYPRINIEGILSSLNTRYIDKIPLDLSDSQNLVSFILTHRFDEILTDIIGEHTTLEEFGVVYNKREKAGIYEDPEENTPPYEINIADQGLVSIMDDVTNETNRDDNEVHSGVYNEYEYYANRPDMGDDYIETLNIFKGKPLDDIKSDINHTLKEEKGQGIIDVAYNSFAKIRGIISHTHLHKQSLLGTILSKSILKANQIISDRLYDYVSQSDDFCSREEELATLLQDFYNKISGLSRDDINELSEAGEAAAYKVINRSVAYYNSWSALDKIIHGLPFIKTNVDYLYSPSVFNVGRMIMPNKIVVNIQNATGFKLNDVNDSNKSHKYHSLDDSIAAVAAVDKLFEPFKEKLKSLCERYNIPTSTVDLLVGIYLESLYSSNPLTKKQGPFSDLNIQSTLDTSTLKPFFLPTPTFCPNRANIGTYNFLSSAGMGLISSCGVLIPSYERYYTPTVPYRDTSFTSDASRREVTMTKGAFSNKTLSYLYNYFNTIATLNYCWSPYMLKEEQNSTVLADSLNMSITNVYKEGKHSPSHDSDYTLFHNIETPMINIHNILALQYSLNENRELDKDLAITYYEQVDDSAMRNLTQDHASYILRTTEPHKYIHNRMPINNVDDRNIVPSIMAEHIKFTDEFYYSLPKRVRNSALPLRNHITDGVIVQNHLDETENATKKDFILNTYLNRYDTDNNAELLTYAVQPDALNNVMQKSLNRVKLSLITPEQDLCRYSGEPKVELVDYYLLDTKNKTMHKVKYEYNSDLKKPTLKTPNMYKDAQLYISNIDALMLINNPFVVLPNTYLANTLKVQNGYADNVDIDGQYHTGVNLGSVILGTDNFSTGLINGTHLYTVPKNPIPSLVCSLEYVFAEDDTTQLGLYLLMPDRLSKTPLIRESIVNYRHIKTITRDVLTRGPLSQQKNFNMRDSYYSRDAILPISLDPIHLLYLNRIKRLYSFYNYRDIVDYKTLLGLNDSSNKSNMPFGNLQASRIYDATDLLLNYDEKSVKTLIYNRTDAMGYCDLNTSTTIKQALQTIHSLLTDKQQKPTKNSLGLSYSNMYPFINTANFIVPTMLASPAEIYINTKQLYRYLKVTALIRKSIYIDYHMNCAEFSYDYFKDNSNYYDIKSYVTTPHQPAIEREYSLLKNIIYKMAGVPISKNRIGYKNLIGSYSIYDTGGSEAGFLGGISFYKQMLYFLGVDNVGDIHYDLMGKNGEAIFDLDSIYIRPYLPTPSIYPLYSLTSILNSGYKPSYALTTADYLMSRLNDKSFSNKIEYAKGLGKDSLFAYKVEQALNGTIDEYTSKDAVKYDSEVRVYNLESPILTKLRSDDSVYVMLDNPMYAFDNTIEHYHKFMLNSILEDIYIKRSGNFFSALLYKDKHSLRKDKRLSYLESAEVSHNIYCIAGKAKMGTDLIRDEQLEDMVLSKNSFIDKEEGVAYTKKDLAYTKQDLKVNQRMLLLTLQLLGNCEDADFIVDRGIVGTAQFLRNMYGPKNIRVKNPYVHEGRLRYIFKNNAIESLQGRAHITSITAAVRALINSPIDVINSSEESKEGKHTYYINYTYDLPLKYMCTDYANYTVMLKYTPNCENVYNCNSKVTYEGYVLKHSPEDTLFHNRTKNRYAIGSSDTTYNKYGVKGTLVEEYLKDNNNALESSKGRVALIPRHGDDFIYDKNYTLTLNTKEGVMSLSNAGVIFKFNNMRKDVSSIYGNVRYKTNTQQVHRPYTANLGIRQGYSISNSTDLAGYTEIVNKLSNYVVSNVMCKPTVPFRFADGNTMFQGVTGKEDIVAPYYANNYIPDYMLINNLNGSSYNTETAGSHYLYFLENYFNHKAEVTYDALGNIIPQQLMSYNNIAYLMRSMYGEVTMHRLSNYYGLDRKPYLKINESTNRYVTLGDIDSKLYKKAVSQYLNISAFPYSDFQDVSIGSTGTRITMLSELVDFDNLGIVCQHQSERFRANEKDDTYVGELPYSKILLNLLKDMNITDLAYYDNLRRTIIAKKVTKMRLAEACEEADVILINMLCNLKQSE